MKSALDLILGRPRVALAPSRLLAGEVTTPYGSLPTDDVVSVAWRAQVGDRECPPWMILGRRDAPSGTIWRLAWCPSVGPMPGKAEIVIPAAAWAFDLMSEVNGPEGWHLRSLESPSGFWVGLWEGSRCEHLQAPWRERQEAIQMETSLAAKHGVTHPSELLTDWTPPTPGALALLADSSPESDLLCVSDSVQRKEHRDNAASMARTGVVLVVLALVTAGFGLFQAWHSHLRTVEEARLESVKALVDRSANLETSRMRVLDTLRTFRDALRRSEAADLVLAGIASNVQAPSRLQVLAMEETSSGWRIRTEARLPDWNAIQPFTQSIRKIKGVSKVTLANQSRQGEAVSAILEIEGVWP